MAIKLVDTVKQPTPRNRENYLEEITLLMGQIN